MIEHHEIGELRKRYVEAEANLQRFINQHYNAPPERPRAFSDAEAEEICAALVERRDAARAAFGAGLGDCAGTDLSSPDAHGTGADRAR